MLKRDYFLILSLAKKSFRYCVYVLSEKQLCNKVIKSHKRSQESLEIQESLEYKNHWNTISDSEQ